MAVYKQSVYIITSSEDHMLLLNNTTQQSLQDTNLVEMPKYNLIDILCDTDLVIQLMPFNLK